MSQLVAACVVVLVAGPAIFIDPGAADPARAPSELLLVATAWAIVLLVGPRWGASSRAVWASCGIACCWLAISSAAGVYPRVHLAHAGTPMAALFAVPCLAAWLGERPDRARLVLRALSVAAVFELLIAALQLGGAPLDGWARALPPGPVRGYL